MPPFTSSSASLVALILSDINFGSSAYSYCVPSVGIGDLGKRRPHHRHDCSLASTVSSDLDAGGMSSGDDDVGGYKNNRRPRFTRSSSSINLSPQNYIRIQKSGRRYDIQTAIITFQRTHTRDDDDSLTYNNKSTTPSTITTVDLHAQIHFGDLSYYQYFNDADAFSSRYDNVLYELIVEDKFLTPNKSLSILSPIPVVGS